MKKLSRKLFIINVMFCIFIWFIFDILIDKFIAWPLRAIPMFIGLVVICIYFVAISIRRLRDIDRPSQDALFLFVPIVNISLIFTLLSARGRRIP
jgi:uncharacterized membrane protein YhaH (DUF805 family)